jgi:hypothetical protein
VINRLDAACSTQRSNDIRSPIIPCFRLLIALTPYSCSSATRPSQRTEPGRMAFRWITRRKRAPLCWVKLMVRCSSEMMSRTITWIRETWVYVVARSVRNRHDRALDVTINRPIQFAIDGSNFYIRHAEDKEHKLTVETKIAK